MDMFQYAQKLIQKYQTHDAYEMLCALGVCVYSLPMRGLRGLYKWFEGWPTVFVDSQLPETEREFVLAHEMGHFLRHKGENRVFLDRCTYLKTDRFEREADLFAACFMYPFPQEYICEGVTVQEVAQLLGFDVSVAKLYCMEYKKVFMK